jgi:hypothetical protein
MADELANVGAPVTEIKLEERILTTASKVSCSCCSMGDSSERCKQKNYVAYCTDCTRRNKNKSKSGGIKNTAEVAFFATHQSRQRNLLQKKKQIDNCYAAGSEHNGGPPPRLRRRSGRCSTTTKPKSRNDSIE